MERVLEKLKTNDEFEQAIADAVVKQCEQIPAFIDKVLNEKKTLNECCEYIVAEAKKIAKNNKVSVKDETVYGWALHYFEEENLKFEKESSAPKVKKINKDKTVVSDAKVIKEVESTPKNNPVSNKPFQMSLFDN